MSAEAVAIFVKPNMAAIAVIIKNKKDRYSIMIPFIILLTKLIYVTINLEH